MSGTFENINVPPMLMAFGITTVDAEKVISPELKYEGNKLYLVKHTPLANYMPDTEQLKANWKYVTEQIEAEKIVSGYALGFGGVAEAICKMSLVTALMPRSNMTRRNSSAMVTDPSSLRQRANWTILMQSSSERLQTVKKVSLQSTERHSISSNLWQ